MVSALRFKGEKKSKKRRRAAADPDDPNAVPSSSSTTAISKHNAYDSDEEGWINSEVLEDLTGPIIFSFSAARSAICIASDAAGAVFASPLDGAANAEDLASAEPDSVQQVWVCNRIHGTDKFSLKSHTGRYLSCDKHGILAATKEAISPEEEFDFVRSELGGGRWALRDVRERFVGAEERDGGKVDVRGDREEVGYKETWTVRLQKRNKKRVKFSRGGGEAGSRVKDRISKRELEEMAGVTLDDDQVKMLKKARREGGFHEALLDVRVKLGKHDKFAY